jgi:hypothetical protein
MQIQWWCLFHDQSDHIWQDRQTYMYYTSSGMVFQCEFNNDVCFMIGVTIYGKTGKHTSVIHLLEQFFNVNSMVMFVSWSEWPYMAKPANTFWSGFSMWIQWWCWFHDWSDWQYQQTHKCFILHSDYIIVFMGEFSLQNHARWCPYHILQFDYIIILTLLCLLILPYMVTLITKQTSPLNSHWKTAPEDA